MPRLTPPTSTKPSRLALFTVAAALLLAACGGGSGAGDTAGTSGTTTDDTDESTPSTSGTDLPDIVVDDLAGGEVQLSGLTGDKPLLVWFWAPW